MLFFDKKLNSPATCRETKRKFQLSDEELKLSLILSYTTAYEPYGGLSILNLKFIKKMEMLKIGYSEQDKCIFCSNEVETLHLVFFFYLTYSN